LLLLVSDWLSKQPPKWTKLGNTLNCVQSVEAVSLRPTVSSVFDFTSIILHRYNATTAHMVLDMKYPGQPGKSNNFGISQENNGSRRLIRPVITINSVR